MYDRILQEERYTSFAILPGDRCTLVCIYYDRFSSSLLHYQLPTDLPC